MASGGKWWQVLGGSAEWAGLLDFVRSCQNLTDIDITVSSRPAPLRGRRIQSLRAFRRTDPESLWIGALVHWHLRSCGLHCHPGCKPICEVVIWRYYRCLEGQSGELGCKVGCMMGLIGPSCPQDGPKMGPRGLQELSWAIYSLRVSPFWAHLGLSWALLGPSWGVQKGILRRIWGLEGLILGCKVAKS